MIQNTSYQGFWDILSNMYNHRKLILQSTNTIVDLAQQIDKFHTIEYYRKIQKDEEIDFSELNTLFSKTQKEMNTILCYSNELFPHLKNPDVNSIISNQAHNILLAMQFPGNSIVHMLPRITSGLRSFAQNSNALILNPTKKSIKVAFGIDVGNERLKIKSNIETHKSNY